MARYASHIWKPYSTDLSGGAYTGGPRKLVLHRTEGGSAAGAFSAYADGGIPHFTWEWSSRGKWQHFDTNIAASALRNDSGGVQTNKDGAIQVEIVGFSANTRDISDAELKWYGEAIREICQVEGIDMGKFLTFYDDKSGFTLATRTAQQRMTFAAWDAFNGVCGHQHVPENLHWDPGAFNYPRMLQLIQQPQEEADLTPEESRMLKSIAVACVPFFQDAQAADGRFQVQTLVRRAVPSPAQIADAVVKALPVTSGGTIDEAALALHVEAAVRRVFADAGVAG